MAWRTGSELFREMWPLLMARVKPDDFRADFVEQLLAYFLECDVDPTDLKGLHPEVDRALERLEEFDADDGEAAVWHGDPAGLLDGGSQDSGGRWILAGSGTR